MMNALNISACAIGSCDSHPSLASTVASPEEDLGGRNDDEYAIPLRN
jgi:hypothetical protein